MKRIPVALLALMLFSCTQKNKTIAEGSLSPQEALKTFQLPAGFKIELVASEPLISDPVAMDLDEKGNMYVVELHGYPLDTAGSGVIKLLTDADGNGMPDKSTVFEDHLRLPTGIMRWKKGFIVVDVPDVLYLEDTNGDGKADVRKVMFTGIALTNPQHIANTPVYGLDNWIYLAHMGIVTPKVSMMFSDTGNMVRFVDNASASQLPRNADGRNVRFNPDTHALEMCSGETQYGHTFDNWGHHFCVENADHIFVEAIAAKYLQRNPDLLINSASDYISDHGEACQVFPVTTDPQNQLLTDVGVITSACGITWYNGGLFPDSFNNVSFTAEPQSNIIHADKVTSKGASFNAARVYDKREFFASTDAWCRPVMMYIGPDGALYVIDYYRQIIEHPEWLSDSVINSGALYNGHDKGRIYRITPVNTPKMNWCGRLNLDKETTEQLARHLAGNNIWWRRNAQRLLVDKKDPQTTNMLLKLLDTTKSATATVHALWALEGLHTIDVATLEKALHHSVAGVRENAVKIAELHLKDLPQLEKGLFALQIDTDAKVRYQLLCTLGDLHDEAAEAVKQKILVKDIEDEWIQVAALASAHGKEFTLLKNSISMFASKPSEGKSLFFENCAAVIGSSQRADDIKSVIALGTTNNNNTSDWWQSACLKGLTQALAEKGLPAGNFDAERSLLLSKFTTSSPFKIRSEAIKLLSVLGILRDDNWQNAIALAGATAANENGDPVLRKDAITLLGLDKKGDHSALFERIIGNGDHEETLIQTAIRSYNKLSPAACCNCVVKNWKTLGYNARETAMEAFLSSAGNTKILLNAIEKKQILSTAISWPHMVDLMNNDDAYIRNRSRELLEAGVVSRDEAIKKYEAVITLRGDTAKGLVVFKTVCATCHTLNGKYGHSFGPDLGTVRNRDAASLMTDILNPNRSIATMYDLWNVTKRNGAKVSGIIAAQTPASITLSNAGGGKIIIARNDVKIMETAETSAMPAALEKSIDQQQMADLLSFLKQSR